ncbi:hypothetical protein DFH09DRAFT_1322722 [Mycena vulgaris]|nr:hypothetical protein DFH09DRAFT_1322722 [Mycena vulgaris]
MPPGASTARRNKKRAVLPLGRTRRTQRSTSTTSPEPSLTESIAESLPAATPEPHEAEDWRVGWDRMVEEIKAANRAIADENWVETLPPPPELTAEQAAEEAAKDTACANAIRICVAAMSEPERRYWQDEEEREARLERQ